MSSQFVDLNGDGHMDILVGSFSGTPQWIEGSKDGYKVPQPILDSKGEIVLISAFWNGEEKKWDESDRSQTEGHCTSSSAVDWDGDGDFDLLLGDYYGGRLYVRLNEGSAKEPSFATTNTAVMAGGEPLVIKKGLAAPCIVDWDGDGKFDILCGGAKGGIYFFRNVSTDGNTHFATAVALTKKVKAVESSFVGRTSAKDGLPTGPGSSFHIEPCDYDGDGDLDLLVGARTSWIAGPAKVLTAAEAARAEELQEQVDAIQVQLRKMLDDLEGDDWEAIVNGDEYKALIDETRPLRAELSEYDTDPSKVGDFVWLLRRM